MMPSSASFSLKGGGHRDAVEHRVHGHAGQQFPLPQGNAQLLVGPQQLGVDLVQALRSVGLGPRRGVVANGLIVDGRVLDVGPGGLLHGEPVAIGLQPPLQQPFRLALLGRDQSDDVFVQAGRHRVGIDVGEESVLVFLVGKGLDVADWCRHALSPSPLLPIADRRLPIGEATSYQPSAISKNGTFVLRADR